MQYAGNRQVEIGVHMRLAGQAAAGHGDAVIAVNASDQLLLGGLSDLVVIVPHDLHGGVDRFGAGIGEQDAVKAPRRDTRQLLGQKNGRLVRTLAEDLRIGQLGKLPCGRFGEPRFGEAEGGRPEAGHAFEIAPSFRVVDIDAFASCNDQRA